MTRDQAIKIFNKNALPLIHETYGIHDVPAVREAWNNFTDALHKDGLITDRQVNTWVSPVPQMVKTAQIANRKAGGALGGSYTVWNDDGDGERYVSVIHLDPGAGRTSLEAAMMQIGLYVPRGADRLTWSNRGKDGVIRCAGGGTVTFSKNGS